jgi:UDP-glucose 4-epimerase
MSKNVCVIGGGSMIGSHLVDNLVEDTGVDSVTILDAGFSDDTRANLARAIESPKVKVEECDIRDYEHLRTNLDGIDEIFHLAGVMSLDGLGKERWVWEVNADGCFNVLSAAREVGARKVVASSSAAVYGEVPGTDLFSESLPASPRTIYGASKVAVEALCQAFSGSLGVQTNVLRYGIVYGPRLHRRAKSSLLVTDIIDAVLQGDRPVITGDGTESIELVYVGDVARANRAAMDADVSGQVFNVGTGVAFQTRDVVAAVNRVLGVSIEPDYRTPDKPVRYTETTMDVSKATELLGFTAQTSLDEGLARQIEHQRQSLGMSV